MMNKGTGIELTHGVTITQIALGGQVSDKKRLDWAILHPEHFHQINMAESAESAEAALKRVRKGIDAMVKVRGKRK